MVLVGVGVNEIFNHSRPVFYPKQDVNDNFLSYTDNGYFFHLANAVFASSNFFQKTKKDCNCLEISYTPILVVALPLVFARASTSTCKPIIPPVLARCPLAMGRLITQKYSGFAAVF